MKKYRVFSQSILLMIVGGLFLLWPHIVLGQDDLEGQSSDYGYVLVQGKAQAISVDKGTITVKPNKGEKIEFILDADTLFIGSSSLEDIKKTNRVKVWYVIDGEMKRVIKIEKFPDLGC